MTTQIGPNDLRTILEQWEAARLDPAPITATIDTAHQNLKRLSEQFRALKDNAETARSTIVGRLAAGELTLIEALLERHALGIGTEQRQMVIDLDRAAQARVRRTATAEFQTLGDQLITDHLGPAAATIYADVAKLAPVVDGINNNDEAFAAGPKVREAWGRLHDADQRLSAIQKIRRTLGGKQILPRLDARIDGSYLRFVRPDLAPPAKVRGQLVDPVRHLVNQTVSEAGPGIYTVAEAVEHFKASPDEDRLEWVFVDGPAPRPVSSATTAVYTGL